jgi:hypothetical protein
VRYTPSTPTEIYADRQAGVRFVEGQALGGTTQTYSGGIVRYTYTKAFSQAGVRFGALKPN